MSGAQLMRLGLVCDYSEEKWTSMDIVADMLAHKIAELPHAPARVETLRPAFRRRLTAMGPLAQSGAAWNADRLWNRMVCYPNWLRARAAESDLFHIVDHSYAHLAAVLPEGRTVVTCHDLDTFRCLLEPEKEPRPYWFRLMARCILTGLQRAAHVIFVSASVRDRALALGLVTEGRSSVAHNGVDAVYREEPDAAARQSVAGMLAAIPPGAPILLSVGSTIARKRLDVLLQVIGEVRRREPAAVLVRVGGPLTPPLARRARDLGLDAAIISLPFLSAQELNAVYRRSTVLLQTSEAEGFGLPLAEAMACGCPVIASDLPVLREVGGTAASYCPVADVAAWTNAVLGALRQRGADPAGWEERKRDSRNNSERFDWRHSAAHALRVYEQLLALAPARAEGFA